MIYDCECPLCFFDDCIRLFAGILLDTEAMKKRKPLALVYVQHRGKRKKARTAHGQAFSLFSFTSCSVPHTGHFVEYVTHRTMYIGRLILYAVDVFIQPPPPPQWFRAIPGVFLHKKNGRTPSVNQLSAFPNIQPAWTVAVISVFHPVVLSFLWMTISRGAHTHTQYDWMSQNKRDGRITKTRSADKTHGVVIITHVRYISPTLAYMYKFSSF
jgi:hypothetical protein